MINNNMIHLAATTRVAVSKLGSWRAAGLGVASRRGRAGKVAGTKGPMGAQG